MGRIDNFPMDGSGWTVVEIRRHTLNVNTYDPLRASGFIQIGRAHV